jgi:hypothetical protein
MVIEINNWLRRVIPYIPLLRFLIISAKFKVERELIKGSYSNKNLHRSIIHFSVNKAATQFVKRILGACAKENGMTPVRINDYAFHSDFPFLDHLSAQEMVKYKHIFKTRGYLYGPFGGSIEGISNLDDYHIVLMVRDPRDILTSEYFSIAYSHPISIGGNKIKSFSERRAFARRVSIDNYIINNSEHVWRIFQRYIDVMANKKNIYITKYEDMIADFPTWLNNLLEYCELSISPVLRHKLLEESAKASPKKENILRHIRQVTPGDYKRKLRQETIDYLNATFANILREFKYE